jgi:hypothetical protein
MRRYQPRILGGVVVGWTARRLDYPKVSAGGWTWEIIRQIAIVTIPGE